MTPAEAQAAIDRRAAAAALAGATLGPLPLLWLIREALDEYDDASETLSTRLVAEARILRDGGHDFWLDPHNGSRIVVERDALGSAVRSHELPNAALVLHDAVKHDPVRAEILIRDIEYATEGRSP